MCSTSNTSSSGGGCGCGSGSGTAGNGGNNGAGVVWSSGLKKQQKRPKVPKRGPGVAELEKILREQEKIDRTTDRGNAEGFSPSSCFITHHSRPYNSSSLKSNPPPPPPLPLPPSPPTSPPSLTMTSRRMTISSWPDLLPLAPKFDHLSPTTPPPLAITSLGGNGGYKTALGRNGGASAVGGPGLVSLEKELFPMNLGSCRSNNINEVGDGSQSDSGNSSSRNLSSESNPIWSHPTNIQKLNNQYPPHPMMNQFRGAGAPISSGSLPNGLHNHVEPPSNQSSHYIYTSRFQEELKMVGMKRPPPPSLDNSLIPPSNFQISPIFSHYNGPPPSSLNDCRSASSFTAANECHRDAKWGSTLELNSRKFNSDNGVPGHANFPPSLATPEVPSPAMHLFQGVLSKGNVLPHQVTEDRTEESYQRSESSRSDHKPFYSFLEVKDQGGGKETTLGSNHGGREAGSNGIDLTLKL